MMYAKLAPRLEGIIGYAALLGVLGSLLHWGIGPADLEKSALLVVLGWLVPSVAVKNVVASTVSPDASGGVDALKSAEVKEEPKP